jgi:hypothetical protein
MKLKLIVLSIALMMSISTFSQIKFGFRAGVSSSTIKAGDIVTSQYQVSTLSNTKIGFQFGLMSQISLFGAYLQPEMLFTSTGGEVQVRDISNGVNAGMTTITSQKYNKLDIPVIIGMKFGPARLGLGPVASIILNKPSDLVDPNGTSFASKFNSATFGYQLDMGLNIWKFALDLKYEGNLSKLGSGVNIGGTERNFDSRNRQWIFGVGYFF